MSVPKKDVDPATELVEEDDEQSLPELETAVDLAAGAGPLAAGRAAILRHVKHAPSAPGVYRMVDAHGAVLYVGKAKNIRKRITSYARPTAYDPRIERMIAATASLEFVSTRTETEALLLEANLIKRLRPRFNVLLRDDKSFPYILITGDHWAPQILKHRGARNREGPLLRPVRLGRGGEPHHHRAAARVPAALLLRRLLREPHAAVPAAPDQALLGAVHARDRIRRLSGAGARGEGVPVRQEPRGEGGARRRDGEGVGRRSISSAPPSTATASPRSRRCRRSRASTRASTEEADVFAVHQDGGFICVEVFFFRTGQNWGNRAYFPKADRTLRSGRGAGRVPRAVLRRQAGAGADPGLARDRGPRAARAGAHRQERPQGRGRGAAARREEGAGRSRARQCARGARPQARRHRVAAQAARRARRMFRPRRARRAASRSTTTATSWAPTRSAP